MSALRLHRGCRRNPSPNPRPSRLPCSRSGGENDNSDGMACSRCSQSTGKPLCGSQEALSSRPLCGSSANVRRLLSSGKNKLQSRPILRDMIQYDSKYNLSLAVAPNLEQNHNGPLFQNVYLESESYCVCTPFFSKTCQYPWKNDLSRVISSPHPDVQGWRHH